MTQEFNILLYSWQVECQWQVEQYLLNSIRLSNFRNASFTTTTIIIDVKGTKKAFGSHPCLCTS